MKRALVTGGSGFVGHHLIEHLLINTDWEIVALVSFRHRGCPLRLAHLAGNPRLALLWHDLRASIQDRLRAEIGPVDYIFNAASESSVEHAIAEPVESIRNNMDIMLNMLEYARLALPEAFIQVSTDEVYGPAYGDHKHKEWEPIRPSNPYSASKAAQEAVCYSYWRTWGVPVVITNTMNIIGERQGPEKLVPTVIRSVLHDEEIPIYSSEDGVPGSRYWLHARNQADALLFVADNASSLVQLYPKSTDPQRLHIVGEQEINNLDLALMIASVIGRPLNYRLTNFHASRPGHDLRYALDGSKMAEAGWVPPMPLKESLEKTVRWTISNPVWLR